MMNLLLGIVWLSTVYLLGISIDIELGIDKEFTFGTSMAGYCSFIK